MWCSMGKRYTYRCGKGHEFEVTRRLDRDSKMRCPIDKCKSKKFSRKYEVPFIRFSGKGFYKTDNPE